MQHKSIFAAVVLTVGALTISSQLAQSAAIQANGVCEVGSCSSPDALTKGQSIGTTALNFTYTFGNGDTYTVTGDYQAGFPGGTFILFAPIVTYSGSSPSAGNDVLTLDMFQNYSSPGANSWDGSYTENLPFTLNGAAGSFAEGQIRYQTAASNGYQSVGLMGPYAPGTYYVSNAATLSGLTGALLQGDVNFVFTFQAGSSPGSGASSFTPEPVQTIPLGIGLSCLAYWTRRRRRSN